MKTIKKTAASIALTLIVVIAMNFNAFANSEELAKNPYYSSEEFNKIVELDEEFQRIEIDLRSEGVLECSNTEIIVVLGEDDKIVYQGSLQLEDENNVFLTRLLTKADFIMSSGNKSFYKVF